MILEWPVETKVEGAKLGIKGLEFRVEGAMFGP